ncbi:unnamed protein product, partial [Polarella glacialis]
VKLHVVPHALLSQAAELVTALPQALAPVDSPASPALSPRSAPKEPDFVATKDPEELFAWLAEDMKEQANLVSVSTGSASIRPQRPVSRPKMDFLQAWKATEVVIKKNEKT